MRNREHLFFLLFVFSFSISAYTQQDSAKNSFRNSVKLDLASIYDMVFDSHFQIRAGAELEHGLTKKTSVALYVDAGLYDKYDFVKYYNFFGQNQGMYSSHRITIISGFHLLPSYNYYFYSFRKKPNRKFFVSAVADISCYFKKSHSYNTLNSEVSDEAYRQQEAGAGLGLGFKNNFRKHFMYELKSTFFIRTYNHLSASGYGEIGALDGQWTSTDYRFWWITNFKIGYVF